MLKSKALFINDKLPPTVYKQQPIDNIESTEKIGWHPKQLTDFEQYIVQKSPAVAL